MKKNFIETAEKHIEHKTKNAMRRKNAFRMQTRRRNVYRSVMYDYDTHTLGEREGILRKGYVGGSVRSRNHKMHHSNSLMAHPAKILRYLDAAYDKISDYYTYGADEDFNRFDDTFEMSDVEKMRYDSLIDYLANCSGCSTEYIENLGVVDVMTIACLLGIDKKYGIDKEALQFQSITFDMFDRPHLGKTFKEISAEAKRIYNFCRTDTICDFCDF